MNDELHSRLGRMEGLLVGINDKLDDNKEQLTEHGNRIGSLEKTRVQAFTIAGVFSFLAGLVGYKINE